MALTVCLLSLALISCTKSNEKPKEELQETSKEKLSEATKNVGYQSKKSVLKFLKKFKSESDEVKKFEACLPIATALDNYQVRESIKEDVPHFTPEEQKELDEAKQYCEWAANILNDFEKNLTSEELEEIAKGVENSVIPHTKKVFSNQTLCTAEEYSKLLNLNSELYTNSRVLSAIVILVSIQRDGNSKIYVPRYKRIVNRKNPEHRALLIYFLDQIKQNTSTEAAIKLKKGSIAKATKAFSEFGIDNVGNFINSSIKTAPNCLSSIGSGVIDISRSVSTQRTMAVLHQRLLKEFNKTKSLPIENSSGIGLNPIKKSFQKILEKENISLVDSWYRPLFIEGSGKSFKLVSLGKDRKAKTADDIQYPQSPR